MMRHVGLSTDELELIRAVFRRHADITDVVLFGSRAKGTHSAESDIDLALRGITDPLRAEAIAAELDELPLPYRFDVQAYEAIQSAPLRDHIQRVGVSIYGGAGEASVARRGRAGRAVSKPHEKSVPRAARAGMLP